MFASKIGLISGSRAVIIASNQVKYNLRTAMGSPSGPMRILVVVNSGVEITSNDAAVPAFDEGTGWAPGTIITLVNNGKIYGMGGAGGNAANLNYPGGPSFTVVPGSNGGAGGSALALRVPTLVDNTAGEIFGGGGGGGAGGGLHLASTELYAACGGGGGGGRGGASSSAGLGGTSNMTNTFPDQIRVGSNGTGGSSSGFGSGGNGGVFDGGDRGGNGGTAGDWGQAGANGGAVVNASFNLETAPTNGGAGGNAVALNGNAITWLGGNIAARVKGAVS